MNHAVPPSFLFQYSLTIPCIDPLPRPKSNRLQLPDSARVFVPSVLDRPAGTFGLKMAWNRRGLAMEFSVTGKQMPVSGRSSDLSHSDYVQVMIDTRHTASVHRATMFCTSLAILPKDELSGGQPKALPLQIAQQRDTRNPVDTALVRMHCQENQGYQLDVWIPAEILFGFHEQPDIGHFGFCCIVHDTELGTLPFGVGGDFPIQFDPSTWVQMVLAPEK